MIKSNYAVKCGNKELLYANRIPCFDNENIVFEYDFDEKIKLVIQFNFNYVKEGKPSYSISYKETNYVIDLYNFNSSLGIGLTNPIEIGKYNNKNVYIIFFVTKSNEANPIIDFALYMEV